MNLSLIVLVIAFLIFFVIFSIKILKNVRLFFRVSREPDFIPNPSWFLGHIYLTLKASFHGLRGMESVKLITSMGKTDPFRKTGLMWGWIGNMVLGFPFVIPTRTEVLNAVLSSKQRIDKGLLYISIKEIFGSGLISSERGIWTKHRKLLNPTFHQQLLHNFVPIMSAEARILVKELGTETQSNNLVTNFTELLSGRVMQMLLGTSVGMTDAAWDPELLQSAERLDNMQFNRIQNPLKMIRIFYENTKEGKFYYETLDLLKSAVKTETMKRIVQLKMDVNQNIGRPKIIDTLVKEHIKDQNEMTMDMLLDEMRTFLGAGWETTTWTATFTLQMVGMYPKIQEKLRKEIDLALDGIPDEDLLTMEDINKLKYLECVVNETLRFLPPINIYSRHMYEDLTVEIDGKERTIPAGTEVIVDQELVHRNPLYWKDPERFIPERFLPENSVGRDPLSFIPFSYGPRNCIGKTFALIEEKIILAQVLRKFEVTSVEPLDRIKMTQKGLTRRTIDPIRFIFKPRN